MVKILIHMSGTIVVVIHISSCQEPICGQVWKSPSSTTTTMRVSWRKSVNFGDKLARTLNAAIADGGWIHLLDCNNNRSHPHGIQTINGLHLQNINNDFGKNSGGIIYQWSPPPPFTLQPLITMKKKFFAKYSSDYELHSASHNPPQHYHTINIILWRAMPFKKSFWNNSQQQPAWCAKEKWKKMRTTTRTLISTTAAAPSGMVLQRSSFL